MEGGGAFGLTDPPRTTTRMEHRNGCARYVPGAVRTALGSVLKANSVRRSFSGYAGFAMPCSNDLREEEDDGNQ